MRTTQGEGLKRGKSRTGEKNKEEKENVNWGGNYEEKENGGENKEETEN